MSVVLTFTGCAVMSGPAMAAARAAAPAPAVAPEKTVPVSVVKPAAAPKPATFPLYDPTVDSALPGAGTALVNLSAPSGVAKPAAGVAAGVGTANEVRAAGLPVSVGLVGASETPAAGAKAKASSSGADAATPNAATPNAATPNATTPSTATQVRVTVTDQKTAQAAGIHGVLFSVDPQTSTAGTVDVSVDDSAFLAAFGGDYASRLHLVQLPVCALTTPALPACQTQTALAPVGGSPLTAQVTLPGPTVITGSGSHRPATGSQTVAPASRIIALGATAGSGGSSGTYAATPLSPAGTWSSSGNTGAFDYSYPLQVPPAIAGTTPSVSLSYDSSSQDGQTEGTNDQSSWVGDGWDTADNYIERSYESCSDDATSGAPADSGDECWDGQVLTLSLNGQSTQIVYDSVAKTFRAESDSATEKIEDLTGATNGTYNGEYWRVTENGVQYYFGLNRLPGYASGDATTQSAWTVPVYGSHANDPCNASTFAASSCLQGWRWNLDYTVDLNGNATAMYYQPETNYYGADMKNTGVLYTRGGYLTRIDYGMTASTVYSATAPEQIVFGTAERCIPSYPVAANTCADSQFTVANAAYWPDVPIDQNCATSTTSCVNHGPTFWTRKRLTSIVTQIQVGGKTQKVDEYDLTQNFPDGGDHAPTLWLQSIQRTGYDTLGGGSGTPPESAVDFGKPLQLANRVGTIPSIPVMYHDRIQDITTETGAQITVTYNPAACTTSNVPSDPSTNTMACFPVYWTPYGAPGQEIDWFQKYTVKSVLTEDLHDPNPDGTYPELLTSYKYDGGMAWHYDDNQVVKAKYRTYGQYRGYAEVETRTGDPTQFHYTNGVKVFDQQTLSTSTYYRGMSSDTPSGTGGTTVTLTSQDGKSTATDSNTLRGQVFEADTYTADTTVGGTIATATVTIPTIIGPTLSQTRTGLPTLTANIVAPSKEYTRTAITGGWRDTEIDSFYNTTLGEPTTGMPIQVDDRGDTSVPAQAQCTWTRYADNPGETLVLTAETITSAQDCSTAGAAQTGQLVSDERTLYDGHAFTWYGASPAGTAPTEGRTSSVEDATGAVGPGAASTFTVENSTTYDSYGRVLTETRTPDSTAPNGSSLAQTSTNSYSPASGALPTKEVTKDQVTSGTTPTYETSTTLFDPARSLPTEKVDIAGLTTDETYDELGRLTAVWQPNESKAAGAAPNLKYSYAMSTTGPTIITAYSLLDNGSYSVDETLYDALMRSRQTQETSENSTTSVSDTQYDSHGWTVLTNNSYNIAGAPITSLVKASQVTIPDTTVTDHDGQGRADLTTDEHDGTQTSTTLTADAGDRTTVIPPTGGVTLTTRTNALGQDSEVDQYTSPPTVTGSSATGYTVTGGTSSATTYTYTPGGKQQTVTGPDASSWSFQYNLQGEETEQNDPDSGISTYAYDDAGNQISATNGRGVELDYTYDLQNRKLTETNKATGFEDASWLYDTLQVGKPTSSTRYVQGVTGGYTVATTGYTSLGQSTGTKISLPASEAPLPTEYTTTNAYSPLDQLETSQVDPKIAGLAGETISYGYDALGNSNTTSSTLWMYVGGTVYTDYGQPSQTTYGPSTNPAYQTYTYDDQTKQLTNVLTSRTQAPGPAVDNTSYTYDASGNPLTSTDQQEESGSTVTDAQCFNYNALDQLSEAWTAAGTCPTEGTDPTPASVATGAAAYWQSYSYDSTGDRLSETDHAVNNQTGDTTTTYTNGGPTACSATADQPHTLTKTSTTGPSGTTTTDFCSDAAGETTSRTPSSGTGQTLTWSDEGDIASVTQGSNVTDYLYDADGDELIRRDPGQTTLFAGDTEVMVDTAVTPHVLAGAVRSYTDGPDGDQVAVRSSLPGGGVDYTFADPHGSTTMSMDVDTQAVTRQQLTPYGEVRGVTSSTWIDPTRGFLNKPVDATTGYTDVGAREYDATLGRFISSDPVLESTDPAQLGGYTYSGDNPILHEDPSGRSWWSFATKAVNVVARVAQVAAPVLNVVALATVEVPGLDVITASAAGIADTVNTVASVAQGAMSVANDVKDGKGPLEIGMDIANTALSVAGDRMMSKMIRSARIPPIGPLEEAADPLAVTVEKYPAKALGATSWPGQAIPDAVENYPSYKEATEAIAEQQEHAGQKWEFWAAVNDMASTLPGAVNLPKTIVEQSPTPGNILGTDTMGGAMLGSMLIGIMFSQGARHMARQAVKQVAKTYTTRVAPTQSTGAGSDGMEVEHGGGGHYLLD